ncbi:DNA-binding transcriptional regulator, LacI/PurR family [Actinopolymorpha cephalotaxi]|uniref:DNA-binding LacI/PurR family transcriptional regulator n=1 Tax=Actinopolymorpha cephalotaxi TaxID=504797 RepID=A0A1I3CB93_9ACTN|nr:substrate-binding domain-containing protein [Actinopolymorpha cephalotaxi]NYH86728.1 DNA-binding LacI/PurR family transcriptional regulator [Actinopolymorpha cephalotaxi]SFH71703.1 DNA-binding transcriptional regulator, LacI/PurR family [Actinopolymorpha cephalotaxi]
MTQVGFVFVRQAGAPRFEPFFNEILVGLESVLVPAGVDVIVQVVEDPAQELQVYRHWHDTRAVDAVVLKDLRVNDDRIQQLTELGMAFAVLADVTQVGEFAAVRIDNARAMHDSMNFLVERGHRTIGRVTGPTELVHTKIRTDALVEAARAAGVRVSVVTGDYSSQSGYRTTTSLLTSTPRPTAVVYDNDLMALGGLDAVRELGLDVPTAVSLLAWDDSVACQLASPPLSALRHDVQEMGVQLGNVLLTLLSTGPTSTRAAQPIIVERGSSTAVALERS